MTIVARTENIMLLSCKKKDKVILSCDCLFGADIFFKTSNGRYVSKENKVMDIDIFFNVIPLDKIQEYLLEINLFIERAKTYLRENELYENF